MEAASAFGTAEKAIETARKIPSWLYCALFLITLALQISVLHRSLPASFVVWLPAASVAAGCLLVCRLAADVMHYASAARSRACARDRERLRDLYRPLVALFIDCHVSVWTVSLAPRLRDRIKNARDELVAYRSRWVGIKRAAKALSDRKSSASADIDFGRTFPLGDIVKLVRQLPHLADERLLQLVRLADHASCENPDAEVTDEDVELLEHVHKVHDALSKKLSWD